MSHYVVPFGALLKQCGLPDTLHDGPFALSRDQLQALIRGLLASITVDEAWYLATYPDVAQAIAAGEFPSAKAHFVSNGYFEGRRPGRAVVDEEFYVSRYPDVAEGIEYGEIPSAQEHFDLHGFVEGRLPHTL